MKIFIKSDKTYTDFKEVLIILDTFKNAQFKIKL